MGVRCTDKGTRTNKSKVLILLKAEFLPLVGNVHVHALMQLECHSIHTNQAQPRAVLGAGPCRAAPQLKLEIA